MINIMSKVFTNKMAFELPENSIIIKHMYKCGKIGGFLLDNNDLCIYFEDKCKVISSNVKNFCLNYYHITFWTKKDMIYTWSVNGLMNVINKKDTYNLKERLKCHNTFNGFNLVEGTVNEKEIEKIAVNIKNAFYYEEHIFVLTETGQVFHNDILIHTNIKQIEFDFMDVLMLTNDGKVLNYDDVNKTYFKYNVQNIKQISCSKHISVFKNNDEEIYFHGLWVKDFEGLTLNGVMKRDPIKINLPMKIIDIYACMKCVYVLTEHHKVYACNKNKYFPTCVDDFIEMQEINDIGGCN